MGGAMDLVAAPGTKTIITMASIHPQTLSKIISLKISHTHTGTQQQGRIPKDPQAMFTSADR